MMKMTAREAFDAFNTQYDALYHERFGLKMTKAELLKDIADLQPLVDNLRKSIFVDDATQHSEEIIEELRATIEECEATINSLKPQTLLDEQKAEILKKLTVLDLETLQHLESVLGLQFAPPYS